MTMRVLLIVGLVALAGCGNGLLPVLVGTGGFIAGANSQQVNAQDGLDGVNCWDLNGDGIDDEAEDSNGDGEFSALDCIIDAGMAGRDGENGLDGSQGPQGDRGERGEVGGQGAQGLPGSPGQDGSSGLSGIEDCYVLCPPNFNDPCEIVCPETDESATRLTIDDAKPKP